MFGLISGELTGVLKDLERPIGPSLIRVFRHIIKFDAGLHQALGS
jgi:hypothetical protein